MPLKVQKRNGKYRLVEPSGKIAKTGKGTARDGGGHRTRKQARQQPRAINRR
jgi:hypothetical protein